jgi:hypothetical protein
MDIPIFSDLSFDLDEDGYPTEETLEKIERFNDYKNLDNLFAAIKNIWAYSSYFVGPTEEPPKDVAPFLWMEPKANYYSLGTAGWSGNEMIIAALEKNPIVQGLCWVMSVRGGLHIYQVKQF